MLNSNFRAKTSSLVQTGTCGGSRSVRTRRSLCRGRRLNTKKTKFSLGIALEDLLQFKAIVSSSTLD